MNSNINPKMNLNMKKIISWGMMLAAAFTLTNCAKEIDAPVQEPESVGYPFEIVASTVDTKTVNDGMSTKWAEGDQLNVFHALGDDTEYVNDGAFTISDVEAGVFTGTIAEQLDVEEEYDWYVLYPYNAKVTTPGTQTAGYTYIGHSKGLNQAGYNSMASLKENICPLYGIAKYTGVRPEITMNHLSSVVAINVTNETEEPLTVTEASFTAPEDIVGSYYIDITGEAVSYTASGASYVNATAIVNVSNGTALAKGESAILYAAIKPFTAAAGKKLTLSVNGYSKEITLVKDVTFTAGKIKTLNFGYDKVATSEPDGEDYSGEWLITGTNSGKLYVATAADNGNGNNLKSTLVIAVKDNTITEVDGLSDCKMTITKITDGGTYDGMYTIKDAKGKYLYAASASSNYLKGSATLNANSYWDITLNDNGTYKIVATKSSNRNIMQFNYNSGTPLVSCYAASTTTMTPITLYPYSMVVPDLTPRIIVTGDVETYVPADGAELTFKYELKNLEGEEVVVSVSDSDMLDVEAKNGVVTVIVSKNEGEARSATLTLSCGDAEDVILKVSQDAKPAEGEQPNEPVIVLSEQFDNTTTSDSSSEYAATKFPNFPTRSKAYTSKYGGIKLGSSSAVGYITTKSLDLSSAFTVQIDACKYGSDTGNIVVTVGSQSQTIKNSELGAAGTFKTFTLTFSAATSVSTVKIATSSKRAYIDNVVITRN